MEDKFFRSKLNRKLLRLETGRLEHAGNKKRKFTAFLSWIRAAEAKVQLSIARELPKSQRNDRTLNARSPIRKSNSRSEIPASLLLVQMQIY